MPTAASPLDALRDGALAGARSLDLSRCGLRELPREVLALADTLEVLDLAGNALDTLPDDFARLTKLRVLFASGNAFERLPPVLGACPALSQVGFRGCGLREVPGEALPPSLRWLTLTDNALEMLPSALGERPALQKLLLAGNRLRELPACLAGAPNLELIRIAANAFEALPGWLVEMPRLAWLAFAGNPLDESAPSAKVSEVPWSRLRIGGLLGEGASGRIHRAVWPADGSTQKRQVAVKLYKGAMTSDGLPGREMAACLAAGDHPNLVGGLGHVVGHPDGLEGLLMPLLPASWRVLAGPPSQASCSRDVYSPDLALEPKAALCIASGIAAATAHLHARRLLHGDLYAHNILWDGDVGAAMLSDFGAACVMPANSAPALERLDVLAFGLLLGELLDRCRDEPALAAAHALRQACVRPTPAERPRMTEVLDAFDARRHVPVDQ